MLVEVSMSLLLNNKRRRGSGIANVDPYWDNVVLYLKGDGANNSTDIIDSSPNTKTISRFNDTKISTTQSKYGGSSIYFDGNGDYLSAGTNALFQLGNDDFTIECWFFNSWSGTYQFSGRICGTYFFSEIDLGWALSVNRTSPANAINLSVGNSVYSVSGYLALNQWHYIAVTRHSSALRMFLNGVLQQTNTVSFNDTYSNNLIIGSGNDRILVDPVGTLDLQGYIDSLRITNGIARYTANFNPETDTYLAY
jgi:hypothetical protein